MSAPGTVNRGDIPSVLRYAVLTPCIVAILPVIQSLDPSLFGGWPTQWVVSAILGAVVGFLQRLVRNTNAPGA